MGGVHFALDGEYGEYGESTASAGGARVGSPSLLSAPGTASMRMPDIDVFEGSRRVAPAQAGPADADADADGDEGAAGAAGAAEVDAGGSRSDLRCPLCSPYLAPI